jgi:hypothetical protein
MNSTWKAVFLVVLIATRANGDDPESLIPRRFVRDRGQTIWVSATEALNEDGRVREGVMHELERRELRHRRDMLLERRQRGLSTDGDPDCEVRFIGYVSQGGGIDPDVDTFAELRDLAASRTVITGTVTASAVGVHFGMPHTVLRIDSDSAGAIPLIYPHGRLRMDGMMVCNADPMYSEPPATGDAITVILPRPLDDTGTLYWPPGSSILYEHEGVIVAAPYLRNDLAIQQFKALDQITPALLGAE